MKWYNKNRTKFLDIDKIGYWQYFPEKVSGCRASGELMVVISGYQTSFYNEEAEEIYKILQSQKEVL